MSSIFIRDIIGTGTYAVPSSDAALAAATSGLSTLIGGVAGLAVGNVSAWVTTGTGSTPRELNASVANVQYNGELCPDATETAAMLAAIEAALIADPNITSVTLQAANLENVPAGPAVPTSHASSHENGGADEISVAGLSGALADAQTPTSHASSHIRGGADEIDGDLADIDYVPSNYTRTVTAPATNVEHLTAHLAGISAALGLGAGSLEYASSESESSITGTTAYQQKTRLTTSSLDAGNYIILWSCEFSASDVNFIVGLRVQIDDTTDVSICDETPVRKYSDGGYPSSSGMQRVALSSGSHTIDLDYSTADVGKTAYIRRARIALWRVA